MELKRLLDAYTFQKICHRYRIDETCQPPTKVTNCERIKTTYNDRKCPVYFCVSRIIAMKFLYKLLKYFYY